jgi:phosphatidylinositol alpha 1,6-mannosyltransferase
LLGVPTVAVFQTDLAGFAKRYHLRHATPLVWAWLRSVHRGADLTLAPSSASAWTLTARGIPRVRRWGRGVDTAQFNPENRCEDLRRTLAPRGEVLVGFVGRLAKEKQVERLASVSRLAGARLVVVGDGPERARLQRLMPDAVFTGHLSGGELGRHVASLDIFVHTGLDETFCQAVQEALSSGVPVVAPAAGGPLDLVTHGQNGFLWSPEQPEMLTGAVAHLIESPLLRRTLGHAARRGVEHRTWNAVLDELLRHYDSVLSGVPAMSGIAA